MRPWCRARAPANIRTSVRPSGASSTATGAQTAALSQVPVARSRYTTLPSATFKSACSGVSGVRTNTRRPLPVDVTVRWLVPKSGGRYRARGCPPARPRSRCGRPAFRRTPTAPRGSCPARTPTVGRSNPPGFAPPSSSARRHVPRRQIAAPGRHQHVIPGTERELSCPVGRRRHRDPHLGAAGHVPDDDTADRRYGDPAAVARHDCLAGPARHEAVVPPRRSDAEQALLAGLGPCPCSHESERDDQNRAGRTPPSHRAPAMHILIDYYFAHAGRAPALRWAVKRPINTVSVNPRSLRPPPECRFSRPASRDSVARVDSASHPESHERPRTFNASPSP